MMRMIFTCVLLLKAALGGSPAQALNVDHLKTGDVLLQSVECFLCSMIEKEEGVPYSHMGVVVNNNGKFYVLEAWQSVMIVPLSQFIEFRRESTQTVVLRPKIEQSSLDNLFDIFTTRFQGHEYDTDFLWDNYEVEVPGSLPIHVKREKYYCSEFVAKLFDAIHPGCAPPKPMHFNQNREYWVRYFSPNPPPDGKPGISPADFLKNPLFTNMGALEYCYSHSE